MLLLGSSTALMARVNALFEVDLKKTVALSTLRQLGIMVLVLGAGLPMLTFFHILTHALFKALLFMCSGGLIHACQDRQDLRLIGGVIYSLPVTSMVINLSNYALCGFPFLAGFYSKDLLLEVILGRDLFGAAYLLLFGVVGLSVAYSLRFTYFSLVVFDDRSVIRPRSEEDWLTVGAKSVLIGLSVRGGALIRWLTRSTPWIVRLPLRLKRFALFRIGGGAVLGVWIIF